MEAAKSETVAIPAVEAVKPAVTTSCRKKKSDDATFLQDVKDHIDEFINASTEEHKTCFTKTIQKMFGLSKVVAQREAEAKHIESALPLQTIVDDPFGTSSTGTRQWIIKLEGKTISLSYSHRRKKKKKKKIIVMVLALMIGCLIV